jgi:hypothetical protein
MKLFNELDQNGNVVRKGFSISPFYKIPDGHSIVEYVDSPTTAQIITNYESAAQIRLDSVAQSWGYDSLVSAASYASSTVAQYKADALSLIAWRDAVWQKAYEIELSVKAGTQTMPATPADFVALLPAPPARPTV